MDAGWCKVGRRYGRVLARSLAPALLVCVSSVASATPGEKVLEAHPRGSAPIHLDGKLDEPVWQAAPKTRSFVERGPVPGAEPPVSTQASVLYDHDALYVGVRCELFPGEVPKADNLVRDSTRVWSDESLTIKFDVRHDRRSTVVFALNPAGSQLDALVVDNGRVFRSEYDAIWEVATHVGDGYWSAEVRIPVAALGLPAVEGARVMGFNVARDHNSRIADYDWSHLPPEFGAWSATHYGELHGVRGIAAGSPFILQPYLRYGRPYDEEADLLGSDDAGGFKTGGDVRLRIGSDTWGEVTVLTDFAQVDVDDQVLDLDRFPIFFPERRPFFLSGLDVFEFGEPETAQLLFTRRIGLDAQRRPVPILAGAKVYGTHGPFDYGVLNVVTDDTLRLVPAPVDPMADPAEEPPEDELLGSAAANWGVARLKTNFANPGHVGFLLAARNDVDLPLHDEAVEVRDEPHLALGMDGLLSAMDDRLELSAFAAVTRNEPAGGDERVLEGSGVQAKARWRGEVWQPELRVRRISENFDPRVGFVRRPGTIDSRGVLPFVHRTTDYGLKSLTLRATTGFVHDDEAQTMLRRELLSAFEVDWINGWGTDVGAEHVVDRVRTGFELIDGIRVQPDRYEGPRLRAGIDTPGGRNPNANLDYLYNAGFFSGESHNFTLTLGLSLGRHVRITSGATLTLLSLDDCVEQIDAGGEPQLACGGLDPAVPPPDPPRSTSRRTLALNSSLGVYPSPDLSGDLTFQLNTQTEETVGQLRFRYRYLPGSDMFLVYQLNGSYEGDLTREQSLVFKIAYRYDAML